MTHCINNIEYAAFAEVAIEGKFLLEETEDHRNPTGQYCNTLSE